MKRVLFALVAALVLMATAGATVVTSIPGGTVVPMPVLNAFGPGPFTFGPGITWSSTNATHQGGSVFGYTGGYGYAGNGSWDGALGPMAGLNDSFANYGVTDTMTFSFATPVGSVGGFLNYAGPTGFGNPTIAVWDASNNLIESFVLTFATGGGVDTGFFYGFSETTPIKSFTLSDSYVGITNLTYSAVPEPSSLLLLGSGTLGLLGVIRRKINR
jgi:PEP-CTERM motif-containing protein